MKTVLSLLALLGASLAGVASAAPLPSGDGVSAVATTRHVTSQLVAQRAAVAPGKTVKVVLDQTIVEGWHTYWSNPGDTGLPTKIKWTLPPGWTAGPVIWPTPRRLTLGPVVNYGYEGEVGLLSELRAPADAEPGKPVTVAAEASWLVCQQMCIPERASLTLTLGVGAGTGAPGAEVADVFRKAEAALPRHGGTTVSFVQDDKSSYLAWKSGGAVKDATFFPASQDVLGADVAQTLSRDGDGYRLSFAQRPMLAGSAPLAGILSIDGRGVAVAAPVSAPAPAPAEAPTRPATTASPAKAPSPAPAAPHDVVATTKAAPVVAPPAAAAAVPGTERPPAKDWFAGMTRWKAVALAMIGGIILNLMPCVFPVLSMKAFALVQHGQTHARRHGLAYAAGVVLSFVAIAGVLLALRAGGSRIGWGFQLQSPIVVTLLAYLMLLLGLSMSGVFTVGASVMGVGSGLAGREGLSGSFFTGVLATVVAAPCTAPFMGAAVTYALLQPPWVALVIFAGLGVGMALPFVLLTWFDGLLQVLPKPGAWMERLKQILAFPLYATAAWLLWVLTVQAGPAGLASALAGALLVAFAAYLHGRQFDGRWRVAGHLASLAAAIAALAAPATLTSGHASTSDAAKAMPTAGPQAFSEQAVSAELGKGRPVLVDFTAAWCITCLANERVALSRPAVQAAMAQKNIAYMKADWTNQDSAITIALQKFGRSGVPLYLLYAPGQAEPRILPQLLTESIVLHALDSLPYAGKAAAAR